MFHPDFSYHNELLRHADNMGNIVKNLNEVQLNEENTHQGLLVGTVFGKQMFNLAKTASPGARAAAINQGLLHLQNVADAVGLLHPNSRHHQSALLVMSSAKEAAAKYLQQ